MSHNLSSRCRPWPGRTPRQNYRYAQDLGVDAAAMQAAARVCLDAGATPEQAEAAADGNPALDGLAEAMQQAGAQ